MKAMTVPKRAMFKKKKNQWSNVKRENNVAQTIHKRKRIHNGGKQ